MQSVTLTFRSGKTRQFRGPESWDELTPDQYCQWVRASQQGNGDADAYVLLTLWYGIGYGTLRLLDAEQRLHLLDLLNFTQTRPSRWMLPDLRELGQSYKGPGDRLGDLSFGKFMYAEAARNANDIQSLAESLYTVRYSWVPGRKLKDLVKPNLDAIAINYLGCLDLLPVRFPHVFRPSAASDPKKGTWLDVGLGLARQTGALGTFHDIENTNLYLVLPVLESLLKEEVELEKRLNEAKR